MAEKVLTAKYRKLQDDTWGLAIDGEAKAGDTVVVEKSNGLEEEQCVGEIVGSGVYRKKPWTLARIKKTGQSVRPARRSYSYQPYPCCGGAGCPECGWAY